MNEQKHRRAERETKTDGRFKKSFNISIPRYFFLLPRSVTFGQDEFKFSHFLSQTHTHTHTHTHTQQLTPCLLLAQTRESTIEASPTSLRRTKGSSVCASNPHREKKEICYTPHTTRHMQTVGMATVRKTYSPCIFDAWKNTAGLFFFFFFFLQRHSMRDSRGDADAEETRVQKIQIRCFFVFFRPRWI